MEQVGYITSPASVSGVDVTTLVFQAGGGGAEFNLVFQAGGGQGSSFVRTSTQSRKIIEGKVLPFHRHR